MPSFLYASDQPNLKGIIRENPEDFQVDELLGFEASGDGEHVLLHIRKKELTTFQMARALSQRTGVKERDIGFCGMKDKFAVTQQYISLFLRQEQEPDWQDLNIPGATVIDAQRHNKKLRRGIHKGNRFCLTIRTIQGDTDELPDRLAFLDQRGAPNYFGDQRFGGDNLEKARLMFSDQLKIKKRQQRSIYLSAARSWLFNRIVSERIHHQCWDSYLDGDVLQHDGKKSYFMPDAPEAERMRIKNGEVHPTGALFGKGEPAVQGEAAALESAVFAEEMLLCEGLTAAGMKHERRSLRLTPRQLEWTLEKNKNAATLELLFTLNRGEFATSVLRELIICGG